MKTRIFDHLPTGEAVTAYRLEGGKGAYAEILDYGATILSIFVPDREGKLRDVVLGYPDITGYTGATEYFGATVGRCANRIAKGRFALNGVEYLLDQNNGENTLHGGFRGYQNRFFKVSEVPGGIRCNLRSPHGEQGFPGTLDLSVTFTFSPENELEITYLAVSDGDTVVNLTNHSYFDLSGGEDPRGMTLWLDAEQYTPVDEGLIPTGELAAVEGTPLDFRREKCITGEELSAHPQTALAGGYDHNFVIAGTAEYFARLYSPASGIGMECRTTLPGVQFYGGNYLSGAVGKDGTPYENHAGIALETQHYPNAVNTPHFPSPILRAGQLYQSQTAYRFHIK